MRGLIDDDKQAFKNTCLSVIHDRCLPDMLFSIENLPVLRACLHGGGGPQVGEVTRLAVVENWPAFTCKLTTPGSRGDVTRHCCVVAIM